MLSEQKVERIKSIFKNKLHFADAEDFNKVSVFYWTTNYYLILREDNLKSLYSVITSNEVLNSIIFDSMPSVLFEFSNQELNDLVKRLSESFTFWNEINEEIVLKTAEVTVVEETYYNCSFLERKMLNEKWIIVLCLFFLYFPGKEILKDYKQANPK
jgi:hypothetical protein